MRPAARAGCNMSAIRLWVPDDVRQDATQETGSEELTVREAWERLVEREHRARGLAESTLRDQRTHLRRWEEWWVNLRLSQPKVRAVGRQELKDWRIWLQQQLSGVDPTKADLRREERAKIEGVARNTNKHLATVQQVLSAAYQDGLVPMAHKLRPLECESVGPKVKLSFDEASALYRCCEIARWPLGRKSVLGWRTFFLFECVYGLRTQELFAYESDHEPLRWSNLLFAGPCPDNDGQDVCASGWLRYVPQKQRAKKRAPVILPLAADARRHLEAMRGTAEDKEPVFAWPRAWKSFSTQWDAIRTAAAEAVKSPRLKTLQIKQLRKTAHSWHKEHGGREIADMVTGHAPRGVSAAHYDVPYGTLISHFAGMGWPVAFADPLPRVESERQRMLF